MKNLDLVEDKDQLALPVTWEAAHALNLGVLDVKNSKTQSEILFKRCNVFNNIPSNRKFAFLLCWLILHSNLQVLQEKEYQYVITGSDFVDEANNRPNAT